MLNQIIERYPDNDFLKAIGFDDAVIGLDMSTMRLIYSETKCIDILSEQMGSVEAVEYFEFNIKGAFVGEKTPIWCEDDF